MSLTTIVVAGLLNVPAFQYEPLDMWVRIACPLLILCGTYGGMFVSRLLRPLGWSGIGLFLVCGLLMVLPGDDYMSGGPNGPPLQAPRLPSPTEIGIRFFIFLAVTAALISGFIKLGRMKGRI